MHIVYIVSEDISVISGVVKKVESKVKYWKQYGHNVTVISLKSNDTVSLVENGIILSQYVKEKNIRKRIFRRLTISEKLNKYLLNNKPDIIYTRYIGSSPDLVHVFKKYAPYIVEINSNDVEETKNGKLSRYILNRLTRDYFLQNASGFVSVSKELMLEKNFTKFNKDFITIGNGYNFNDIKNKKSHFNNPPKFIFIGSPNQIWHGTDKILILARKLKNYEFHIVGPTKFELESHEKLSDNIIAHGYCNTNYLEKLLLQCDIGISTLALHRNNMKEASPLKSREYLAYGLPIIIGYEDTDLPKDFEFALNIGNNEDNIVNNIGKIEIFTNLLKNIGPNEVIKNSKQYLDYATKEKLRLDFIEKIYKEV